MNRRALLGVGVFGASIAATLGASALLDEPRPTRPRRAPRRGERLDGVVTESLAAFFADPEVRSALVARGVRLDDVDRFSLGRPHDGLNDGDFAIAAIDSLAAEDIEFRRPVFTSPVVLQARPAAVEAFAEAGLLRPGGDRDFVDVAGLLLAPDAPFALADPAASDAAWLFAALAAAALGANPAEGALRRRLQPADDMAAFMQADPAAAPARVGLERDLPAWIASQPGAWAQLQAARPDAAPVTLHLRPTIFATWTVMAFDSDVQALATALLSSEFQTLAASRHGLRGSQRQPGTGETFSAARLGPAPTEVAALPGSAVMETLVAQLSG